MKRNNIKNIRRRDKAHHHKQALIFHEAGHATAIYLYNKSKNLPPVYFEIVFEDLSDVYVNGSPSYQASEWKGAA